MAMPTLTELVVTFKLGGLGSTVPVKRVWPLSSQLMLIFLSVASSNISGLSNKVLSRDLMKTK